MLSGAKACKSCRSRQELSNESVVQIFIFQSLSMSLFLNFFSNEIAIQTSIYLQNLASIQPRTSLRKVQKMYALKHPVGDKLARLSASWSKYRQTSTWSGRVRNRNRQVSHPVASRRTTTCCLRRTQTWKRRRRGR